VVTNIFILGVTVQKITIKNINKNSRVIKEKIDVKTNKTIQIFHASNLARSS
jgi:hypothetical protein